MDSRMRGNDRTTFLSILKHQLQECCDALMRDCGLRPVVASEIEFYLRGSSACDMPLFWQRVREHCARQSISIYNIEDERGFEQHEVALTPTTPDDSVAQTLRLIAVITQLAQDAGMRADFSAKPFPDQPGSGLHIHLHLEDSAGRNVFTKHADVMSAPLAHSIGGLLAKIPQHLPIFAPSPQSYARFACGSNAPTTISWGANNRTVAIRLPDTARENKHIEHRVAGADADPAQVMAAILQGVHYGLTHQITPPPQIYGDASLPVYGLPRLQDCI